MQGTKNPTFRPTVWPAEPPAVPPVFVGEPLALLEPGLFAAPHAAGGARPLELPPDFVLRELLDTAGSSEAELVDFANRWGPPTGYGGESAFYPYPTALAAPYLEALREALGRLDANYLESVSLVSFGAIDLGLRVLRSMSRHLLAYLEGEDDAAVVAAWADEGHDVEDLNFAWFVWDYYLNRGLAKFTVHVRTENPAYPTELLRPGVSLYDACCLQLVHYLASEAKVIRCANERCRRPFTRQRGRAREDYGQYRSRGVRYCSHLCAKAQSERDRRRRRAAEGS